MNNKAEKAEVGGEKRIGEREVRVCYLWKLGSEPACSVMVVDRTSPLSFSLCFCLNIFLSLLSAFLPTKLLPKLLPKPLSVFLPTTLLPKPLSTFSWDPRFTQVVCFVSIDL